MVGMEMGINSLGSLVGGRFTWYPFQQLALDFGGGWSLSGMRGGVGSRYFLFERFNSPFIGVAWMRSSGVDSASLDDGKKSWNETEIKPLQFVNAIAGYEWRRSDGLVVALTTGWSFVLTPQSERYKTTGTPSSQARDWRGYATGSGPVGTVMVGYGF